MELNEIIALLETQFPGVRKDGLNQLARVIAMQVNTKEEATGIVGKLTAEAVAKFVADWRKDADAEIDKANKTEYENYLKEVLAVKAMVRADLAAAGIDVGAAGI